MAFTVSSTVSHERVCDMIVGAFEGGSNYWLGRGRVEPITPDTSKLPDKGLIWYGQKEFFEGPFKVTIEHEDEQLILDNTSVLRGLSIMAEKYGRHFSDMITENDDADTSDVFLQCCLFGEVVYG